jgi:hypothetical protein
MNLTIKKKVTEMKTNKNYVIDLSKYETTSAKIRFLASENYSRSEIEKILKVNNVTTKNGDSIRYQHIRNVLITPLSSK